MSRRVEYFLAAVLLALIVLIFTNPRLMVAPGKLAPGHAELKSECLACHTPFKGVSALSCLVCHKPADIGRVSSKGQALAKPSRLPAFHESLTRADCLACHRGHAGMKRVVPKKVFRHDLLFAAVRKECRNCHKAPRDVLHKNQSDNCSQCHEPVRWTPAVFEHEKYFVLDRAHNVKCITCHEKKVFSAYTCYGCHDQHSPEEMKQVHDEEHIKNFKKCTNCHRSAAPDETDPDIPARREARRKLKAGWSLFKNSPFKLKATD